MVAAFIFNCAKRVNIRRSRGRSRPPGESRWLELLRVAVDIRGDRDGRVGRRGTRYNGMNHPTIIGQNKLQLDHSSGSTAGGDWEVNLRVAGAVGVHRISSIFVAMQALRGRGIRHAVSHNPIFLGETAHAIEMRHRDAIGVLGYRVAARDKSLSRNAERVFAYQGSVRADLGHRRNLGGGSFAVKRTDQQPSRSHEGD
jgi:hypothetical protein